MEVKVGMQGEVSKSEMDSNLKEDTKNEKDLSLRFTGNWFVDAGILGFVNLMEEVYGDIWKSEEESKDKDFLTILQNKINENPEVIYYGYFPFGYLFYHSKLRVFYEEIRIIRKEIFGRDGINQKIAKINAEIYKLNANISKYTDEKERIKIEKKLERVKKKYRLLEEKRKNKFIEIENIRKKFNITKGEFVSCIYQITNFQEINEKKIKFLFPDFKLKFPASARNFYLFNSKETRTDPLRAYKYLSLLCQEKYEELLELIKKISPKSKKVKEGLTYELYPDSTINPFLYSPNSGNFSNLSYTLPLSIKEIKNTLKMDIPIYLLLLSFFNSFQFIGRNNVVFYTNNLEICYSINKIIRIKKEQRGGKSSLFQITWSSIIDELIEHKAKFALENMYIIEYEGIEQLKLKTVEYLGISKLQASIILDDIIRDNLNRNIQYREKTKDFKGDLWLLEEFIKGKPLYPIILNNVWLKINNKTKYFSKGASIYSLAVDAQIRKLGKNSNKLFSQDFFKDYKWIVNDIKREVQNISYTNAAFTDLFKNVEESERKKNLYEFISALRSKNRSVFVNILLKILQSKKEKNRRNIIENYINENLLKQDNCWEIYALSLIIGLINYEKQ